MLKYRRGIWKNFSRGLKLRRVDSGLCPGRLKRWKFDKSQLRGKTVLKRNRQLNIIFAAAVRAILGFRMRRARRLAVAAGRNLLISAIHSAAEAHRRQRQLEACSKYYRDGKLHRSQIFPSIAKVSSTLHIGGGIWSMTEFSVPRSRLRQSHPAS